MSMMNKQTVVLRPMVSVVAMFGVFALGCATTAMESAKPSSSEAAAPAPESVAAASESQDRNSHDWANWRGPRRNGVSPETGLLFIKRYPDISSAQFAPGEAEIELYASPRRNYIEIEQQGAYRTIPPMSSVDWTVTWYLQHIGAKNNIGIGDTEMVRRARATQGF